MLPLALEFLGANTPVEAVKATGLYGRAQRTVILEPNSAGCKN